MEDTVAETKSWNHKYNVSRKQSREPKLWITIIKECKLNNTKHWVTGQCCDNWGWSWMADPKAPLRGHKATFTNCLRRKCISNNIGLRLRQFLLLKKQNKNKFHYVLPPPPPKTPIQLSISSTLVLYIQLKHGGYTKSQSQRPISLLCAFVYTAYLEFFKKTN